MKRATIIEARSERIDDLPVVIHWLEKMAVQKWLDEELPTPQGNRQGLSYGQLAVLLLTYIISQSDPQNAYREFNLNILIS